MQKFVGESQNKIDNLTKCVQESNTGIFLREQELQRLRARNEELSKENADLQERVGQEKSQRYDENEGSREDRDNNESSPELVPKKQVVFDDFEKNLVDVKQTIKETDELIAKSKGHVFS